VVLTVLTDSMDLYRSRIEELRAAEGAFGKVEAVRAHAISLEAQEADHVLELTWPERRRVHNLKYYTWVEQQGKSVEELNRQWGDPGYWRETQALAPRLDEMIDAFNREVAAG